MIPYYNHMYAVDVPNSCRPRSSVINAVSIDYPFKTDNSVISILGSCNGIFLIGIFDKHIGPWNPYFKKSNNKLIYSYLYLWNPSTKQYKKLPTTLFEIPEDRRNRSCNIFFGLGYDLSTDDYKVVRILYDYFQCPIEEEGEFISRLTENSPFRWESEVHVYSMRRDTCKRIQDTPYLLMDLKLFEFIDHGIHANGVIHWFSSPSIVSFNVTSEKFNEVQTPDFNNAAYNFMSFGVLEGCLCVSVRFDDCHVEGFMMKEYGVKESWTKIFSVSLLGSNPCVRFKALCIAYLQTCPSNKYLVLYDPTKELREMHLDLRGLPAMSPQDFQVEPYIRSLVSLKA
ncbi:F-box protein cpr1 [Thalictrum thalictroides]|uniref:F-box protein cpr1 n=1 Tax=Thalictrum thalictroides TaxID=46969 RepID=A0A7J6WSG8_THATH|nr:F-box protein cpr1 [Thalictrum thalictroides]